MALQKRRKTIGLALGSGGIRGLAHVGVIKALVKHGIPIDFLAGSSIGAWVGAHYALFRDIERLEEFTVNKKEEKLHSLFEPTWSGGFIKGDRARELLSVWLENATFEETQIPVAIVATDLHKRRSQIFTSGPLAPAVQASVAIPGMFRPVLYQGNYLVDGGITNPVPSDVVKQMGADIVIAVNLYRIPEDSAEVDGDFGVLDVANRTIEIMRYCLANSSTHLADITIEPLLEDYAGWTRYFMQDVGPEIVAIGEQETEKILPELRALLAE